MSSKVFTVGIEFLNGINTPQLTAEINADTIITTTLTRIDTEDNDVTLVFDSVLSTEENTALNTLVAAHTPVTNLVQSYSIVKIKETESADDGYWKTRTVHVDALKNTTSTTIFTYPLDMSVYVVCFQSEEMHRGDIINMCAGKGTPLGPITASASIGDTTISLYAASVLGCMIGYDYAISEGSNFQTLGIAYTKDTEANTISFEKPLTDAYTTAAQVVICRKFIDDYELSGPEHVELGQEKIGAKFVPANTSVYLDYTNKSTTDDKVFVGTIKFSWHV